MRSDWAPTGFYVPLEEEDVRGSIEKRVGKRDVVAWRVRYDVSKPADHASK
ncbi:MAG: hypothetical protein M3Q03_16935 [Chloroflexota bacterium]|nr:hypothetical protein [Chloroflexota bacterium]